MSMTARRSTGAIIAAAALGRRRPVHVVASRPKCAA